MAVKWQMVETFLSRLKYRSVYKVDLAVLQILHLKKNVMGPSYVRELKKN